MSSRNKELQDAQTELHKRVAELQQAQQRTQDDALQLAQRDEQISRLHEQALVLEKECACCKAAFAKTRAMCEALASHMCQEFAINLVCTVTEWNPAR
jgi:uncharacterized protein (DUF3084 family)